MAAAFEAVRQVSVSLCEGLCLEDFRVQSIPEVSPPWWNLGHTSWFFARNLLQPAGRYRPQWQAFEYPLNSYYEGLGPRLPREQRGAVSRPLTDEVLDYREQVDAAVLEWISVATEADWLRLQAVLAIGLQHEQQHQELFLTEILHNRFADAPQLRVPYRSWRGNLASGEPVPLRFVRCAGGLVTIGHQGEEFAWDNELPAHQALVQAFQLANRPVTCGEWLQFVDDGGYRAPLLWLANGWSAVQQRELRAPLYWEQRDGVWWQWTLRGLQPVDPAASVCHVSFYEADAFARWFALQGGAGRGVRLPTEREWEHGAQSHGADPLVGNLLDEVPEPARLVAQRALDDGARLLQVCGDAWEWTSSHYEAYPGYRPFDGALTEYNGKFMDNQRVLRGGSLATPRGHLRLSYRNFWPADTRFQFTGLRLAKDADA